MAPGNQSPTLALRNISLASQGLNPASDASRSRASRSSVRSSAIAQQQQQQRDRSRKDMPVEIYTNAVAASETQRNEFDLVQMSDQLLSHETDLVPAIGASTSESATSGGYFAGMKLDPHPPDLEAWRERLFNLNEMIRLSEEQFLTYFPHVDNVYSHRSTQTHKRKPFLSHYWDCRLKGRPPGTPKSDDPNKKKRKRTVRPRDLCDVKIKITEYLPTSDAAAAEPSLGISHPTDLPASDSIRCPDPENAAVLPSSDWQQFGVRTTDPTSSDVHPQVHSGRFFTIQRIHANTGNGGSDGMGGGHRHTLQDSDRVKKNSVQRWLLKTDKDKKEETSQRKKTYHTKATGVAATTVQRHSKDEDLKLYGSCFCPFVQRVWITLELKNIPYQYIEIDPYQKPPSLLEVNPRGLVPALRHGDWGCYESNVLLEYLEDLNIGAPLLPPNNAKLRAHCRLWADHVNRLIVPGFYRVLQEQDQQAQISKSRELKHHLDQLITAADQRGPFFLGSEISFVDVQIAPWVLRLGRVLKPYRDWPEPEAESRWAAWVDALENNEHVQATTSSDELYLDSYERYAENRPNTSQVANAINSGSGLP